MLALSRKKNEAIIINNNIEITVLDIRGDQIKLGIAAPKEIPIYRKEVYIQIQNENKQATEATDVSGIEELKKHPFFKNIDFNAIERKEIAAPFIPIITNNTDVRNFDEMFTNEKLEMSNIASKNVKLVQENQYKFEQFAH